MTVSNTNKKNSQLLKSKLQNLGRKFVLKWKGWTNCYFMDGYLNGDMFGGVFAW
jgi:hypothetical protein